MAAIAEVVEHTTRAIHAGTNTNRPFPGRYGAAAVILNRTVGSRGGPLHDKTSVVAEAGYGLVPASGAVFAAGLGTDGKERPSDAPRPVSQREAAAQPVSSHTQGVIIDNSTV